MTGFTDSKLRKKIRLAKTISFDVFDTAVLRMVAQPVDLFELIAAKASEISGLDVSGFQSTRQQAETTARDHAWQQSGVTEITLADIYDTFCAMTGINEELAIPLAELEIRNEQVVCRQNPFIHGLYKWCLEQGKCVVFISDIYLPEYVIGEILGACGYERYDDLLVSSSLGKTKATGELFTIARSRFLFSPQDWLHIGDNERSDVIMPRRQGMAAWHYHRCGDVFMRDRRKPSAWKNQGATDTNQSILHGLLANRLTHNRPLSATSSSADNFWPDFGYAIAGPVYVSFVEWLIEQAAARDLQALYFLARDGRVMRKIYNMMTPLAGPKLENHYLYGSRRALNFAAIEKINEDTLRFLVSSGSPNMSAAQYLERLGLNWHEHMDAFQASGFSHPEEKVVGPRRYDQLCRLFKALADPIRENARKERDVMCEYLFQSGLYIDRRVGLVDIGWHGSMQRSLARILARSGARPDITGLYFGTFKNATLVEAEHPHDAYLFRLGQPSAMVGLMASVEIVELLFSAVEGSTIRIERDNGGGFIPIRDNSDLVSSRMQSITQLQEGALQFVEDYLVLKKQFPILNLPRTLAVAPLGRILRNPLRDEARHIGDIPHVEGFGGGCTKKQIAPPFDLLSLLTRPMAFKRELKRGYWKIGSHARVSPIHRAIYRLMGC